MLHSLHPAYYVPDQQQKGHEGKADDSNLSLIARCKHRVLRIELRQYEAEKQHDQKLQHDGVFRQFNSAAPFGYARYQPERQSKTDEQGAGEKNRPVLKP